jgi:hypothetical protein
MKQMTFLLALLGLLALNVSCNRDRDRGSDIEREEVGREVEHEMDEMGDNMEDAVD